MYAYLQLRARGRMWIGESLRGVWLTPWDEDRRTLVPFSASSHQSERIMEAMGPRS